MKTHLKHTLIPESAPKTRPRCTPGDEGRAIRGDGELAHDAVQVQLLDLAQEPALAHLRARGRVARGEPVKRADCLGCFMLFPVHMHGVFVVFRLFLSVFRAFS